MFTADCQDTTGTINKNGTSWHPTIASIGEITCITCTCHVSVLHVTIHDCLSFFVRSSKKDATILVLAIKWRYLKKIFDLAIAPLYTQYWMILMNEIKIVLIRNTTQKEKKIHNNFETTTDKISPVILLSVLSGSVDIFVPATLSHVTPVAALASHGNHQNRNAFYKISLRVHDKLVCYQDYIQMSTLLEEQRNGSFKYLRLVRLPSCKWKPSGSR